MNVLATVGWPTARDEWSRLAAESANVFLTPEWAEAWWDRFGGNDAVVTLVERAGGDRLSALLVGYVPERRPLRALRLVGRGPADELGIACARAHRADAAVSFGRHLREADVCDIVLAEQLPGDVDWGTALGGRVINSIASPSITLDGDGWNGYLASRSREFRRKLRRTDHQLEELGGTVRLTTDRERLDRDFETFLSLHRQQLGPRSPFVAPQTAEFHRSFARSAFDHGWLRLWLLELRGQPVAGWYGFRFAGSYSHYQSARLPELPLAAGWALVAHAVRAAFDEGMREYRFLRGGEAYKYRWATADDGLLTVAAGITRHGRLATRLASSSLPQHRGQVVRHSAGRVLRRALLA